jgi:homotetrameric cytidine deaminase
MNEISDERLLAAAREVRGRAYAPYSGFAVGAAIRAASGAIHVGANVENAAYPQGQCAEASALGAMIAAGDRVLVEIAVVGSGEAPCAPCGGCRQRLAEFGTADSLVVMAGATGEVRRARLGELLPHAFTLAASEAPPVDAVAVIRARAPDFHPQVGLILGSGLDEVARAIEPVASFDYRELPGFPRPTVEGHAGRLELGRLGGVPVACLRGRAHLYEGHPPAIVNHLVRTLHRLGCASLVLTNASGSLRPDFAPGALVLIEDHLNLMGTNPLIGPNDPSVGPRFVDLSQVYDAELRAILQCAAEASGVTLGRGVYAAVLGPAFETPAEIRAFRVLGADLVGMSTVPEAISARHCGLRVAAVSIVTNAAAGLGGAALTHDETLREAAAAATRLRLLLEQALPEFPDAQR